MTSKQKTVIRVGIAGQGRSGYHIHANWLRNAPERYAIMAVADQFAERRADAERKLGARTYADYRELIADGGYDLFVNALPSPLHTRATIEALRAGYHVVCEKPMARNIREFDRMTAAAAKCGRLLAPFQNNRLQPFFLKMQEIIRSGVLGKIIHVRSNWSGFNRRWDWQTFQCNMGGCLFNTGPHAIDQALTLFGPDQEPKVFCRLECNNTLGGDADDLCALTIHGPNAPTIEILISSYLAYPQSDFYCVSGTRGGLTGNANRLQWRYYDPRKAPKQEIWKHWSVDRQYPREDLPWVEKHWEVDQTTAAGVKSGYTLVSYQSGVRLFYENIHDVLMGKGKLLITLPQVRRQIAVIEKCLRQNKLPKRYTRWVPGKGAVK